MSIPSGTRLGPYEVLAPLGAGGMGEVYRARDERLDRDVALKVFPDGFARDLERLARFEREAKLLASLNHPHIAAIYGLEEANGLRFLVLELVEGETLAERVGRGSLPVEEALETCRQIAEALEAAHEKGVIHRDLKPANVKVTPEGKVKVLDFGLAKALAGEQKGSDPGESPTLSDIASREGIILGTAAYMSPEQARGKAVDKRADIWAFGCVLYELLSGARAFGAETVSDTLAASLTRDPNWALVPPNTPVKVQELLRRCLQKDPKRRLHDIADARLEIEEALTGPASAIGLATPAALPRPARWQQALPWGVAAASTWTLLLLAAVLLLRPPSPQPPAVRAFIPPPTEYTFETSQLAVSPDGSKLAFRGWKGGVGALWVQSLATGSAQPVPNTPDAIRPFWSPDGKHLGFCDKGKLQKVDAAGGPIVTLVEGKSCNGGAWNREGVIVFAAGGAILQVPASGGPATEVIKNDEAKLAWRPSFLPNGRHFLFYRTRSGAAGSEQSGIYVGDLKTGEERFLMASDWPGQYVEPGFLLYVLQNTLMAQPFDAATLAVSGDPVPIGPIDGTFAASNTGVLAYFAGGGGASNELLWYSRDGRMLSKLGEPADYGPLRLSPDGRLLAMEIWTLDAKTDVWVHDLARGILTRITFEKQYEGSPVWAPDGKRILFSHSDGASTNLRVKLASGLGRAESLFSSHLDMNATDWSADRRYITYEEWGSTRIGILELEPEKKTGPLLRTNFAEKTPRFSADGRWLAYSSNETGRDEVYVVSFPGLTQKWKVSTNGGTQPVWRRDRRELFYVSPDSKIMAVSVTRRGDTFDFGQPVALVETRIADPASRVHGYDVTPDGQRFIVVSTLQTTAELITVISNWTAGLKK